MPNSPPSAPYCISGTFWITRCMMSTWSGSHNIRHLPWCQLLTFFFLLMILAMIYWVRSFDGKSCPSACNKESLKTIPGSRWWYRSPQTPVFHSISDISWKCIQNPLITFWIMLLTDSERDQLCCRTWLKIKNQLRCRHHCWYSIHPELSPPHAIRKISISWHPALRHIRLCFFNAVSAGCPNDPSGVSLGFGSIGGPGSDPDCHHNLSTLHSRDFLKIWSKLIHFF